MTTVSVLRARTGGYVGRGHVHPALLDAAREALAAAKASGAISDGYVARCGDAIALVLAHTEPVLEVASDAFGASARVGARLGQHAVPDPAANGGIDVDAASLTFEERPSEPIVVFAATRAGAGSYDLPLYRAFADPLNTAGLTEDGPMFAGFRFEAGDAAFSLPEELHAMLASRDVVARVVSRATGDQAAAASTGDDPVLIVRCEDAFPSVAECLEPFAHVDAAPVSTNDDAATRPGLARIVGLGFQFVAGRLIGPRDLLGDRAFDEARRRAMRAIDLRERRLPTPATRAPARA